MAYLSHPNKADMEVLGEYGSDDEGLGPQPEVKVALSGSASAPSVAIVSRDLPKLIRHDQKEIMANPTADILLAPVSGPANPFRFNVAAAGARQAGMGTIEDTVIEDWTFDEQYQTYQRSGFALDVSTNQIIGDINEYHAVRGDTAQTAKRKYSHNLCMLLFLAVAYGVL